MKILLVAINAKYIHSNLAVYCLKSYAAKRGIEVELTEYTINHRRDDILMDIYQRKPDVVAFSCYIWNLEFVQDIAADLYKVLPDLEIWGGGPEVSYDAEKFLAKHPEFRGIMKGEGERTFCELAGLYQIYGKEAVNKLDECHGIVWRDPKGEISQGLPQAPISLDEVPFIYEEYENMMPFENRILYYETSRGCPFSCSYCLSSIDKRVRLRSMELVEKELQFFLDHKVPQVKFVDRTFNAKKSHAMAIWKHILEHDNGVTNFHFEITADLLDEEELDLISRMRPGLIQLEIGVQSTNPDTIKAIRRKMDLDRLRYVVERINAGKNVHQHLDLIAGLPFEDYDSFGRSFNDVYSMEPEQFQLGFLKVLKGSYMHEKVPDYDLQYRGKAPYEVLSTKWLPYSDVLRLKGVEDMVEVYYNSRQFMRTLKLFEQEFDGAFAMYEYMAGYYDEQHLTGLNHSRLARYEIFHDLISRRAEQERMSMFEDALMCDLYLRENAKSRPSFALAQAPYKEEIRHMVPELRTLGTQVHAEVLRSGEVLLFDYREKDRLNHNAKVTVLGRTDV